VVGAAFLNNPRRRDIATYLLKTLPQFHLVRGPDHGTIWRKNEDVLHSYAVNYFVVDKIGKCKKKNHDVFGSGLETLINSTKASITIASLPAYI
jgi:hypothetical protein